LLKQLRDVMAGEVTGQERLDQITRLVAADMVAEVCSVYISRAGEVLELFSTHGLKPEAVHRTRMRVGEGLVGDIALNARPLALSDAQSHPNFAYFPETGEEIYSSLMGVPILRGNRVLGVLVLQNRTKRSYAEEEVEALQTIAMVLAELAAGGELVNPDEVRSDHFSLLPTRYEGVRLNGGMGIGQAFLHAPRIVIQKVIAEDPDVERNRMAQALAALHSDLDDLLATSGEPGDEQRDILEAYKMFAEDRGWLSKIEEAIKSGLTAEAAVQKVQRDTRARMAQIRDPYIRERMNDLDDLANRTIRLLTGVKKPTADDLPDDMVLCAQNLGPAELLDYDRSRLRALVLEEGATTSHVAIIARALDIPVIGRMAGILDAIETGDSVIVDGDGAQVHLRPTEALRQSFNESMRLASERRQAAEALRDLPAVSLDGVELSLRLNVGLPSDMDALESTGAEGVGLYRTEIPFMMGTSFPTVQAQAELYRGILDRAGDRTVVFRMLDAGGDKRLPYWGDFGDENPAMGWRAIRIGLDRPAMLRQQIRALLMASEGRPMHVMMPMVAEVAEIQTVRRLLEMELARLSKTNSALPSQFHLGAMVEVPSLLFQVTALLRNADFLAVGSNDLAQFLFASDRGNPRVAGRYDVLSPSMLSLIQQLAIAAKREGRPLSVCGEMAGSPLEAMALIGAGVRILSMSASSVSRVKAMVRSIDVGPLESYLTSLLEQPDHSLRPKLKSYALDHGVII